MKPFVLTLRAVGAEFVMRLYVPIAIGAAIIFILLFSGGFWLTTLSSWWWLLLIPLTSLFCIVAAAMVVFLRLIKTVRPDQTKVQKQAVGQFVDKLQSATEVASTPKFLVLFRVIRSIAAPSKDNYLSELVKNRELAGDFRALERSFDGEIVIE